MELIDKYVPDFSNILTGKTLLNFNNYFMLLSEESVRITANPFVSILVPYLIKNNINVILLVNQESLHHYATIAKKFVRTILNL
jgi:hypothetical protein